jgi:hypothetical protein
MVPVNGESPWRAICGPGTSKKKRNRLTNNRLRFVMVGVSRFELPAPRPPDAYSNLTELHPDDGMGVGVGVGVHPVWVGVGVSDFISAGQI